VIRGLSPSFFRASTQSSLDPLTLQAMAIALALLGLGWVAARLLLRRRLAVQNETDDKMFALASLNRFLNPAHPRVDAVVNWALLALLAASSLIGVHVGIIEDLAPGRAISSGWQDAATVSLGLGSGRLRSTSTGTSSGM